MAGRVAPEASGMTRVFLRRTTIAGAMGLASCPCEDADGHGMLAATDTGDASDGSSSSGESTGAALDASRWIGRYHHEDPWLTFGGHGRPLGAPMLVNFEIFADATASLFYDECGLQAPVVTDYRWEASADGEAQGWLRLYPLEGEAPLRLMGDADLEVLRVRVSEPCRALMFETDGSLQGWLSFRPGESCWVDRCSEPGIMQLDYCEGEEPAPCQ
jgi:hypothetical protein